MAVKAKAEPKTQTSQKSPYPGVRKAKQHYAETTAPPSQEPRDIEQAVQAGDLVAYSARRRTVHRQLVADRFPPGAGLRS